MSRIVNVAAVLAAVGLLAVPARAEDIVRHRPDCSGPADLVRLGEPLSRVGDRLAQREPVKILAFGSSSTVGIGATSLDNAYPNRLEAELHVRLPGIPIRVLNRGVSGEDVDEMLLRLERDVIAENPDLVLWQLGTNAILRLNGIAIEAPIIRDGLRRIRSAGADVLLIDPQYAPKVLRDPDAHPMVALLSAIASEMQAPVFHRFALMQYWHEVREISFADMLSADLFHMNDWSYACLAQNLARAIVAAVPSKPAVAESRPAQSASVSAQPVSAVVGAVGPGR